MTADCFGYPHSYPILHLLGQRGSNQSHECIEYGSSIVVVQRFEPSRHGTL